MMRFSIVGIPVTVRLSFWLVAVFLGFSFIRDGGMQPEWVGIALWVGIVFLGVLSHEMGHALVARHFGARVRIELTTFGGFTAWSLPASGNPGGADPGRMNPGLRALVAVAGSGVGVIIGLATWGVQILGRAQGGWPEEVFFITGAMIWVNLGWGVLNWAPLRPLDGGHILEAALEGLFGKKADTVAVWVFFVLSVAAAYLAWRLDLIIIAVLAGFLAVSEFRRLTPALPAGEPPVMSYDEPDAPKPEEGR